ncbi:MAG TPA: hypothetical protein VKF82_12445 [Candidatus Eremiobacteraceae bacterium]|nr:hypothetical protein [Candidatus Eremiobacteraceae bacterium]
MTEKDLRHPLERRLFIVSVILNFVLMAAAIALIVYNPPLPWLKDHPLLNKELGIARLLAITALIGIPMLTVNRNRREAYIRGNSVRLSRTQFPEIYAILEAHCSVLEMTQLPELFLTADTIKPYSQTYSAWHEDYIILHQNLFGSDYRQTLDVVAFTLGHELGALRLHHTALWNDMLLTYVHAIKFLANPLSRIRVFSRDRYGAFLAPTGFRGLLIYAAGRRMMDYVDIPDYLAQARRYGGFWSFFNAFFYPRPQALVRIQELRDAGFTYKPVDPNLYLTPPNVVPRS